MTKYSADNVAGPLELGYAKRFYSPFTGFAGFYHYSSQVLIKDGAAAVFNNDVAKSYRNWNDGMTMTLFDWSSGVTTSKTDAPGGDQWGNFSFHIGESVQEVDSHHNTASMVWGDDGRIYARRGGDHYVTAAYDPAAGTWTKLTRLLHSPSPGFSSWGGDTTAFLNRWQDQLVYRPGDTRNYTPYIGTDISSTAWENGTQGDWKTDIGPFVADAEARTGMRYSDYPKINPDGIAVVAGRITVAGVNKTAIQATSLATGEKLWSAQYNDSDSRTWGFYTSLADYWRYIATDNGTFVTYTDAPTRTLRALNITTGVSKWTKDIGSDHPALASHGNFVYIIGDTQQMKVNEQTGEVVWSHNNPFQGDYGYKNGLDVIYRPMALTDDTIWFIDGSEISGTHHNLVGMRTSDGQIIQIIDLAAMVTERTTIIPIFGAVEHIAAVNDLVVADGKLGVLLGIRSWYDPNGGSDNALVYQDLFVFDVAQVPEPASLALLCGGTIGLMLRRRKQS
ncbi:MAG: PEP-CTERM sorting domain-containing protein [Phycisphaeraceae bacterium]